VRVRGELRRAGRAAGVEEGCCRVASELRVEAQFTTLRTDDLIKIIGTSLHLATHLYNGELWQFSPDLLHFLRDLKISVGPEGDEQLCIHGAQQAANVAWCEHVIDGADNARNLCRKDGDEGVWKGRQQESHDIITADAKRAKRIGAAFHPRKELLISKDLRLIIRSASLKQ